MLIVVLVGIVGLAAAPWLIRQFWEVRGSNTVRRGVRLFTQMGCYSCHGELGRQGIADPGDTENGVPAWTGGVWMMYVKNDEEIRKWIDEGSTADDHEHSDDSDEGSGHRGIKMPAYGDLLSDSELDDLVAAFKVASGMIRPAAGTTERRGHDLARKWNCLSCHGVGASGGMSNPGSFAGFIPGWYGNDFGDLVKDRKEFDQWILAGSIPRMDRNPIASHFIRKQRISMPEYENLTETELDDLWMYAAWLAQTDGGHIGEPSPW